MAVDKNKISAEATRLVQKGQLDKAIRCYERILAHDPADVRVLLKVGELQQKKGDPRAASATFERCAETYAEQGFLLKSVAVYKQIVKLAPEEPRISERLAALYQQLGLASDAMGQLQLVAAAAERAGDETALLDVLRRIVELDPENVASSVKLGETYARMGQAKLATEHLSRAAAQLKRNSRVDEYLKVAERISALVPEDWALAREIASIQLARGDAKRALSKLQPCFKADPKNVETLTLLAQAFQDLGQTPKLASVYRELARIHAAARDAEAARGAWRRVLELAPDDAEAAQALGSATRPAPAAAAETTAASAAWGIATSSQAWGLPAPPAVAGASPAAAAAEATAAAPGQPASAPAPAPPAPERLDAERVLVEADVYLKYGLHEKALQHLEKVFAEEPDHLDGREKASRIREQRNDLPGAAEESLRVARAALSAGLEARARAAFERARSLAPDHPALAGLATALHAEPTIEAGPVEEFVLEIDDSDLAPAPGAAATVEEDGLALTAAVPGAGEVVDETVAPAEPAAAASDDRSPGATPAAAASAPEPPAAALAAAAGEARADALAQDLAEIDFFIAQGLLEDARDLLRDLEAAHPGNAGVASRARDLERAGERRPTARPEPVAAPAASGGDYLYSVRDVLEPFKKGVERAVGADDAETHYDLGIAYREMGLVDDALGEFEQALRSAADAKRVDALAMIGLCRAEQGDAAAAIAAYRNALRIEGVGAERRRAVEYQLASAYEAAGDRDAALWYLQRILAEEPTYRDVRSAVARLGGGPGRAPEDDAPGGSARQEATADTVAETGAQARSP